MNAAGVEYSRDADGVGWIVFDEPAARANVFNSSMRAALDAALSAAEQDRPRALVLISGKERIFIAGADLKELAALLDAGAAEAFARAGQRRFQRLVDFPAPVVCAIHGACAGGGFELALACDARIASDAAVTRIGLPETSLGTIPGWGGSARLPRLIGVASALDHLLKAKLVSAEEARRVGLVDDVVPAAELRTRAKAVALQRAEEARPRKERTVETGALKKTAQRLREGVNAGVGRHNPALLAVIDTVERGVALPLDEALELEARTFGEVTAGRVCKNLIRVFFLREAAKKRALEPWFDAGAERRGAKAESGKTELPRRVGVVGAGVMGSGIAQWVAAHGVEVVLRDVDAAQLARGMAVVRGLLDDAVKRAAMTAGEANAALQRIATTTAWDGFDACDFVVEAIVENVAAKRALFTELAGIVAPTAILTSNTSALPIEEIAGQVVAPERTIGIHFFNPVSRMPLVELVLAPQTSAPTAQRALALVQALGKSPIVCRSSPGFLVTRVLFFYLNAAVRRWEEGGSIAEIDGAMREFGWPMGPLRLIDEVGVDVTDFIFGELEHYFPARFHRSRATERMLAAGLKGRKNGAGRGFYRYDEKPERPNEAEVLAFRTKAAAALSGLPDRTSEELMRVMVEEARRCLEEGVVKSADDVDFAMLSGTGFPTFRGGLLHWAGENIY